MVGSMGSSYPSQYRQFLSKLKAARIEAGLTQVDVAKRLKKPQSFISKFENGERRVDAVELSHIAALYGKPISYFLD
jgi:transcriptional regulator with XRE-family HTH domain